MSAEVDIEDFSFDNEDNDAGCPWCGGEGFGESDDDPGSWGEDIPPANHLVTCSGCGGSGLRKDCDVQ